MSAVPETRRLPSAPSRRAADDAPDAGALADALNRRFHAPVVRLGPRGALAGAASTGFPALDAATGLGGLPLGRITEIVGHPTSGRETIAARTVAAAPAGAPCAWVDVTAAVDVAYLAGCGVALDRLAIVRPPRPLDALGMAGHLAASGHFAVVVLDALADLPPGGGVDHDVARFVRVVTPRLARARTALVVLTAPERHCRPLAHGAALRVALVKVGLLRAGGVLRGWRTRATLLKSPGLQGGESGIEVWL